jgi:spore coat polysaccharide biosynthesis protein SpsF
VSAPIVALRCDASEALGLGHLVRCCAVADALRDQGARPVFLMREGADLAEGRGHRTLAPEALEELDPDVVFLDLRHELTRADAARLREGGRALAVLDDPGERRLAADLAFYPPVPQVAELDWSGFEGELLVGWDWAALRPEFSAPRPEPRKSRLLVTMGGSDPAGLTLRALDALADVDVPVEVLVGPRFAHEDALDARGATIVRDGDVRAAMERATAAVASFGMTAYELAATGVPAVLLCLTDDHARSASAFHDAGLAVSLGRHDLVSRETLAEAVHALVQAPPPVPALVDGRGAARIAARVAAAARSRAVAARR